MNNKNKNYSEVIAYVILGAFQNAYVVQPINARAERAEGLRLTDHMQYTHVCYLPNASENIHDFLLSLTFCKTIPDKYFPERNLLVDNRACVHMKSFP